MKYLNSIQLLFFLFLASTIWAQNPGQKLRVLVLTDIENEPDDAQSMVRFLTYSNQWDVEGLIATTSTHLKNRIAPERIEKIVNAYGKVRDNLLIHEKGYPETKYLLSVIKRGLPFFGMEAVGPGKDSEGSEWIIKTVDKKDDRSVWISVWGGTNCLAQALWKVKMTRSLEDLEQFVRKIRVYTISDQDDTGPWIRRNFPSLFYIVSPGYHAKGAYHYATWSGISGDQRHSFSGPDFSIVDNPWLDENIRNNHGPLGAEHPHTEFLMEGDTPTFLYLINNGLSEPEHPDWGSWGGRYELYIPRTRNWFYEPETRPIWTDTDDEVLGVDGKTYMTNKATIWRWRQAYQNDFAARIDWTIKSYKEANHPPLAVLNNPAILTAKSGENVLLSAEGSKDPDGNTLSYQWIYYREPGSFETSRLPLDIKDNNQKKASFVAPAVTRPETIHIILAVADNGTPALTRYQRVIITVYPENLN
ncbi:DUF1593 domain-containing protein [Chitinophagaceae bacterium LB-8]|uniref:DUF1593 domain-containing protein n=1 Tax=Paraflavisolibacter caeni TaxID=2982496 RepID=A0A9X2XQ59_9BACT|nr:DUF1593 domain-containing protein [Paraflavisolibacter caeni]MCU7552734.1 DUF1593 domain-containing protein [Paraflavisolibacter caeni]